MRTFAAFAFACSLVLSSAAGYAQCTPRPAQAPTDADKAFAAGDFARAESLYAGQSTPAGMLGLVHTQLEENKLAAAVASAQKAAAVAPTSSDAQALLGEALLRSGQVVEAAAAISKAYTLDRCSPRALFGFAQFNEITGRRASAAREFSAAHAAGPGDSQITAAWLENPSSLPDSDRAAALKALLASSPTLSPAAVDRLSAALALAEAGKACTATWPDKAVTADLSGLMTYGTHARAYGLKLKINAATIPLVELDSGVSGIVLNPRDAKAAGVHALSSASPVANATYYAVADVIRVGDAEFHDCPVRVAPAEALANSNSLIGTDFFRDRRIHIDWVQRSLTLTQYPGAAPTGPVDRSTPPDEKDWSQIYIADGGILVPTLVNKTGPVIMLLDTGSFVSVFAPGPVADMLSAKQDSAYSLRGTSAAIVKTMPQINGADADHNIVHGASGQLLKVSIPNKHPDLHFAGTEMLDRDSISFDISAKSHETGVELTGLIGFSVLKEFAIDVDYRNNLVKLTFDSNHLYDSRENDRKN